ncbi:MAG: hypothetical protein BroJett025_05590 [Patescibacteria group bacterium]|nr:MAG: hypothetical protein BroJett025_05590 [Patescibacteria group bacterium]
MLEKIIAFCNRLSITDSVIRVNELFFTKNHTNELRLRNNLIFRHACATPLTILSCSLDSLNSDLNVERKRNIVSTAKEAVTHLTELIAAVTRPDEEEQEFEVNRAINEVIFLFKGKTSCSVYYSNFLPKKIKLYGNKLYFQEIIICLLNNAYEAYQDKSMVHISVSARIIKGQVFLGVVDFAKGMTHLGQKLALVKGISYKENGLGLGLSFVKQTIENEFKGVMKIISGYGVGTHVQVAIPIPEPYNQNLLQS